MGASKAEEGWHSSQSPQHEVAIAPFWMGKYPVTQAQWGAVAALPKVNRSLVLQPSCFDGKNRPVEQVTWLDAVEFCDRLSLLTGLTYRLPTEAEWEYSCRATTQTPFCFGETITTELANYSGIDWEFEGRICSKGSYGKGPIGGDRRETTEVGSFQVANQFGLFDLHGNVREWCQDCWHNTYENAPSDGSAWVNAGDCAQRILRGGSWNSGPRSCRSAARGKMESDASLYDIGFRIALNL
jgi:formylglycine-generating enzyme required for sulfatase activity